MKVVVPSAQAYPALAEAGHELIEVAGRNPDLTNILPDLDGAIGGVRSGASMERAPNLRVVISPAIGVDNIDSETANRLGILVCNSPSMENLLGVAESAVGLMVVLNKRMKVKENALRGGGWSSEANRRHMMLGQTVGFVGFGRIPRAIVERMQGWRMKFIAYDPYVPSETMQEFGVTRVERLLDLMGEADFVSLHIVPTPETYNMIGEAELRAMKPTAYFINTSRGQGLDEDAMCKAITEDWIAGAALDVFHQEPLGLESPLRDLDPEKVIITPHSLAHSIESREGGIRLATESMLKALSGEVPEYVTNKEAVPRWLERFGNTAAKAAASTQA